jgi:hypothetical protein
MSVHQFEMDLNELFVHYKHEPNRTVVEEALKKLMRAHTDALINYGAKEGRLQAVSAIKKLINVPAQSNGWLDKAVADIEGIKG